VGCGVSALDFADVLGAPLLLLANRTTRHKSVPHGFDIPVDVSIPKSDDTVPLLLEPRLANPISYGCLVLVVMSAIEFNDKARSGAEKSTT
jgi:hypothetical protein